MNKRKSAITFLVMICVAAFSASSYGLAQGPQEQARLIVSPEVYGRILDVVFAHEEPRPAQLKYSILLRFMSTRHAESEVVIHSFTDGSVQVIFQQVSGESAWNLANAYIQQTGSPDAEKIAKLIEVKTEIPQASSKRARLWYSGLLDCIKQSTAQFGKDETQFKRTGETTIFLDGSTYELRFQQGLAEVHWTVMDEEVDDANSTGHAPLPRWMNDVRRYSLDHAARRNP